MCIAKVQDFYAFTAHFAFKLTSDPFKSLKCAGCIFQVLLIDATPTAREATPTAREATVWLKSVNFMLYILRMVGCGHSHAST